MHVREGEELIKTIKNKFAKLLPPQTTQGSPR